MIEFRSEIVSLLNSNYSTNLFQPLSSFHELISIAELALKKTQKQFRLDLNLSLINKYSIILKPSTISPFSQQISQSLALLANLCNQAIANPDYQLMRKMKDYIINGKNQAQVVQCYKQSILKFRYIGIKQAMIFTALSQCKIWFTICKERKKSKKDFDLDPLINYFDNLVKKWNFIDPYHKSILPRKQIKFIQKKNNIKKSNNPLYEAVAQGDINKVKDLILNGADIEASVMINQKQQRQKQIQFKVAHKACGNGDLAMCQLLHSFGVNWESEDNEKMTPIFYAVQNNSFPITKFLVEVGKVNIQKEQIQKRTAFYFACTKSNLDIIKYLYEKGCNINHQSQLGRSALSKACYLGRRDIVEFLLSTKQIQMISQDKKGRTALHNAVFGPKGGRQGHKFGTNQKDSPQCAQILLQKGFPVDITDFQLNTPLHVALSSEAIDSIRVLVAFGGSLTARNNYQQTPLLTASKFGHLDAVTLLIQEYKCDVSVKDIFGKNILLLTAKFNQGSTNPVFFYCVEKVLQSLKKQSNMDQIEDTFRQLVKHKCISQLKAYVESCRKLNIPLHLKLQDILKIVQFPFEEKQFIANLVQECKLSQQDTKKLLKHLIQLNNVDILKFLNQNCKNLLNIQQLEISCDFLIEHLNKMKEKMTTYCLLGLDFKWLTYRDSNQANILHWIVRFKKYGTMIQLFKVLSGIRMPFVNNPYLQLNQQELKANLKRLLIEQDKQGFDVYKLSMLLKQSTFVKMIEQKIKSQNIKSQSYWDVKQYSLQFQTDPLELQIFNLFEVQDKLEELLIEIQKDPYVVLRKIKLQNAYQQWINFDLRKLYYCNKQQDLKYLQAISQQSIIGIDIQYFILDNKHVMSIIQISTPQIDFIIDCLSLPLSLIKLSLKNHFYNPKIIKVMHGADNDLQIIKTNLNLSLVNFIDTSRLHIEIKKQNDLKGLALLCENYLKIEMLKQYQTSQWKIRPLPKAMIDYARRDSMILPYLVIQMLKNMSKQNLIDALLSGCKQARKNKKLNQKLIKNILLIE